MTLETTQKYIITIDKLDYNVLTTKDGSKFVKFQLIEKPATKSSDFMTTMPNDLFILDSVHSGIGRNESNNIYNIVMLPILNNLNIKHEYIKSTDSKFISNWAKQFNEDSANDITIIFISGDTSISEFINSLPSVSKRNINILPLAMGTANALANSLNLNCPIDTFKNLLMNKLISKNLPLYNVVFPDNSSKLFFIILSMGFHANLLHKSNDPKFNGMGVEKFQLASKEILQDYDLDQTISIVEPYSTHINKFAYFALINTPNLEEHYMPSPRSKIFKSELHLLGYLSNVSNEILVNKIMQGYSNHLDDDITSVGTIYKPIHQNFNIKLPMWDGKTPRYKYEICCDGLLYNLLDFEPVDESRNNNMLIQFMEADIKGNTIKVFSAF